MLLYVYTVYVLMGFTQQVSVSFSKYHVQLEHLLKDLHVLHCLKWKTKEDNVHKVEEAISKSLKDWFKLMKNSIKPKEVKILEEKKFENYFQK